jgi:hypothetical protein
MLKEKIFDQVQKRTPYQVPENYFAHSKSRLRPTSHRRWYWTIAASLVLVAGIWSIVRLVSPSLPALDTTVYSSAVNSSPVYSTTPADDWSDFAEADLFLENMNW